MTGSRMRHMLCIAISLASLILFASSYSLADEKCGYPDVYGAAAVMTKNRLGEFRVGLEPPDYNDVELTQRHFIASRLWGILADHELVTATRGVCRAIMNPSLFPDMWAYLIIGTPEEIEGGRRVVGCIAVLSA